MNIFTLIGTILVDNSKADQSISKTEKKADGLGKTFLNGVKTVGKFGLALGGMAATAGGTMLALATKSGQVADRLLDLQAITGMSTDEIQRWERVTKVAGVSADAMTNASQKLTKSLDTMAREGGKGADSLEALGLSFDEIIGMNADERMNAITEALSGVEDGTERAKLGTDLLGGSWKEIAPIVDMGTNAMKEAKSNANIVSQEDLNKANNFRIRVEELKDEFGHYVMMLGVKVLPMVEKFFDWIDEYMPQIKQISADVFEKMEEVLIKVVEAVKDTTAWFKDHWAIIQPILIGIGAGVGTFYAITGAIAAYGAITKVVTALQLLFNGALLANPIGLVVVAIGLLVAAGVALYKNWDVVKEKWFKLVDAIKSINLYDVGKNIIQGLINGITNMIGKVGETVSNVASKITGGFKSALGIKSPSKVMEDEVGEEVGEGAIVGMQNKLPRLAEASRRLSSAMVSGVSGVGKATQSDNNRPVVNNTFHINDAVFHDDYSVDKFMERVVERMQTKGGFAL